MKVKVDLHVHTIYSHDSIIEPKDLVFHAKERGLNAVAITDHDRIDGALRIAKKISARLLIIPGIEISSKDGHILALNPHEAIPKGLSSEVTVERIHQAGGIAVACHPFALFKGSLKDRANGSFDAIETINSSAFPFIRSQRRAQELACHLELPCVAGTDAHYGPEIGLAYTLVDSELKVEDIIEAVAKGFCKPLGGPTPLLLKIQKNLALLKKRVLKSR